MNLIPTMPWFIWMFLLLFGIYWCWMIYLMFARPQVWLEWFMNKPFRWWGLQVAIFDAVRFRRLAVAYLAGTVLIVVGAIFLMKIWH